MTRKERYLKALRGEQTDQLVWAPNFDWWHQVNTRNNTVPKEYQGLSGPGPQQALYRLSAELHPNSTGDGYGEKRELPERLNQRISKTP